MSRVPNLAEAGSASVIPLSDIENYQSADDNKTNPINRLISRRHPEYFNKVSSWRFFSSTYHGGRAWFNDNVYKYFREGDTEYKERVERAYRFNHTKEVVDLVNKYLFKQAIQRRSDAPHSVLEFWKHATQGGAGINEFAKQIGKHCSIFGRIAIVVDRQKSQKEVKTVADEKKANLKTYAYIVSPIDLLDYSFDDEGNLNWVLIQETYRNDADPLADDSLSEKTRYRMWTRTDMYLFEESKKTKKNSKTVYELKDHIRHNLGEVPVIFADNLLSDERYGAPALINDIAYLDRAVANYLSNLDAIIQDQTFSQLVMPAQNILAGEDQAQALVELGTKRVFLYDAGGSTHSPEYISPDPQQAHLILDVVSRIIKEIYNSVGLSSERTNKDNAVSMDNSSGVAKAYDFERVNALLSAKADSLEVVENKIAHLVALWNGEDDPEEEFVQYPDNFDTRGLYDEFDISARLMLVDAPDKIRQEQMRMIVDKLFPMLEEKLRKEIDKEIKEWPMSKEMFDGNALTKRTSQNNLGDPKNTVYKTSRGGKGDATKEADGSASDKKRPTAVSRQGEVTRNTGSDNYWDY
jgi:hypothetical protein